MNDSPEKPSSFEQAWRQRFTEFAEANEDDAGIAGWSESGLAVRLKRFGKLMEGRVLLGHWLDAGCGAGTYSRLLAAAGADVVALDYSLPTLQKARLRSSTVRQWCVSDVNRLPLQPRVFDGALCFGVTQALSTSTGAVRELAATVKPGGEIWIDGLNAWCIMSLIDRAARRMHDKPMHLRYESPHHLRTLLCREGLVRSKVYWVPILPGRLRPLQWVVDNAVARAVFSIAWPLGALLSHAFIVRAEMPVEACKT